jgi:hypothetical protein
MYIDIRLGLGLVAALVAVGVLDWFIARLLGLRLEWRVRVLALVIPLVLLGPWLTRPVVLAPTNLLETILPGAPELSSSQAHRVLNDAVYQFLPWEIEVRRAFDAGHLPLWSEGLEGGSSLWVNPQAGVLSPLVWVARPFEIQHFLLVMIALKVEHALLGVWLLCRRVGVGRGTSLVAALGFPLCGAMSAWALFPHTTALSWVPWLAVGVIGLFRSRTRPRIAVVAVLTACLLLSGHPEVAAGGGLLAGCAGLALRSRRVRLWRGLGVAAIAAILGFGLAAPALLPFAAHVPDSLRAQETLAETLQGGEWRLLEPRSWLTDIGRKLIYSWANPRAYGHPYGESFDGAMNWAESLVGYPGIAALLGAALALLGGTRRRTVPFIAYFVVAHLLAANVRPLVAPLDLIAPLRTMAFTRLLMPAGLAIWVAAAAGLDAAVRQRVAKWKVVTGVVLVAIVVLAVHVDTMVLALVAAAAGATVCMIRFPRFGLAALAFVTLAELLPWARAQFPEGSPELFFPRTAYIDEVAKEVEDPGRWRAVGEDWAVFPSILTVYGIAEARPHNPLSDARHVALLSHVFGFSPNRLTYFPPFREPGSRVLDFLNVRAIVWNSPNTVPERFVRIDAGVTPDYALYRNPDAVERWFLPRRVTALPPVELPGFFDTLEDGSHVSVPADATGLPLAGGDDRLERTTWRSGRVTLSVRTEAGALVATSLPWPEGWRATLADGSELRRVIVNYAFFGFVVPAGEHEVELRYVPPGFAAGLFVGLVAMIACVVLFVRERSGGIRARRVTSSAAAS